MQPLGSEGAMVYQSMPMLTSGQGFGLEQGTAKATAGPTQTELGFILKAMQANLGEFPKIDLVPQSIGLRTCDVGVTSPKQPWILAVTTSPRGGPGAGMWPSRCTPSISNGQSWTARA